MAGVCEDLAGRCVRGGEVLRHRLLECFQPRALFCREHAHGVERRHQRVRLHGGGQVGFVEHRNAHRGFLCGGNDLTVIVVERARRVEHRDGERGVRRRVQRPVHADGLYGVGCVAQSGGVGQAQEHATERDARVDRVAGRAGHVRHDRALIAEQGVEQGGLARVRAAEDHGRNTAVEHICPGKRVQQPLEPVDAAGQCTLVGAELKVRNVLVRVVDHGVIVAGDVLQRVVYTLRVPQHRAAELPGGVFCVQGCLGVDEVDDGLRLREIHAAVEKGALREFARQRLPCPGSEQRLQPCAQHGRGAVALQLGRVLAGVAVRSAADGAQAEVERLAVGVAKSAVDELAVRRFGHGAAVGRAKHAVDDGERPVAGQAQDANRGQDIAGRDGGDRIRHEITPLCRSAEPLAPPIVSC